MTEEESLDARTSKKKRNVVENGNMDTIAPDITLIQELLSAQVPLNRVIKLFQGRVEEREVNTIAKRLVYAAPKEEDGSTNQDGIKTNNLSILGMSILERSQSVTQDSEFIRNHTENLSKDAPDEFLDPLFQTIMRDPVVLSSGHIVDKSTVLDNEGKLKFRTCPWTREPLREQVYPLLEKVNKLKEFKLQRVKAMVDTASRLLDDMDKPDCYQNLNDFYMLQSSAAIFLEEIGTGTYKKTELMLAELNLAAWEKSAANSIPTDLVPEYQIKSTAGFVAKLFVRIFQALPPPVLVQDGGGIVEHNNNTTQLEQHTDEKNEKRKTYLKKVTLLEQKARAAIEEREFDDAIEWCDACETVVTLCGGDLAKVLLVDRLRLDIGLGKGDVDLMELQRRVYRKILRDHSEKAAKEFLDEQGIDDPCVLRDLRPSFLLVSSVNCSTGGDEWQEALQSNPLEGDVAKVMVSLKMFKDQDWGNTKGKVGLALYDTNEVLLARCNLFGTCRSELFRNTYEDRAYRTLYCEDDDVISKARPGFTYKLEFIVGGGGGHKLHLSKWACRIFFQDWNKDINTSQPMNDPEGDGGIYIGPVDDNNKANGNGRLEYYDGKTFIGCFSNGSMVSGVCYSQGGKRSLYTMVGGVWTTELDRNMIPNFPLGINQKVSEGENLKRKVSMVVVARVVHMVPVEKMIIIAMTNKFIMFALNEY